jgi:hypothetical protein
MIFPTNGGFPFHGDVDHSTKIDVSLREYDLCWVLLRPGMENPHPYLSPGPAPTHVAEMPALYDMVSPNGNLVGTNSLHDVKNKESLIFFVHAVRLFVGYTDPFYGDCRILVESSGSGRSYFCLMMGPYRSQEMEPSRGKSLLGTQSFQRLLHVHGDWVHLYERIPLGHVPGLPVALPRGKMFPRIRLTVGKLMSLGKDSSIQKDVLKKLVYTTIGSIKDLSAILREVYSLKESLAFYHVGDEPDEPHEISCMEGDETNLHCAELHAKMKQKLKKVQLIINRKSTDLLRESTREAISRQELKNQKKITSFFTKSIKST